MSEQALIPVILAGGVGTRLWPLSRELYPKQLLQLAGAESLLQQTLLRLDGLETASPLVVCGEGHRFIVAEQLRVLGRQRPRLILEPVGRNTAPAIALAALAALEQGGDRILLVLPSDHVVAQPQTLHAVVQRALPAARAGALVTFGIPPRSPATGYGYIQAGDPDLGSGLFRIHRFVEKPALARAQEFLADGGYYWNSGMFMFTAEAYVRELGAHAPALLAGAEAAYRAATADQDFLRIGANYADCPADSIDYAVMEKTRHAMVAPLDAGWSDLGTWEAVAEHAPKDSAGNVLHGDVVASDCRDSLIWAEHRLVAAVKLSGHVVIETADAVLIAPKSESQQVKKLVEMLKTAGREQALTHRKVHRPWGTYETLAEGARFKVKHIVVRPGASLSLQRHRQRAEHWVVVGGVAKVQRDDEFMSLGVDQSTYIPQGARHRLENTGAEPLEIIEVQSGDYVGEDDIERFEDRYGRAAR
ncbi:MAG: mannose-1-phosphate guanylyltransferase/mannose-6-phosphate isomerase [Nevskiales bacterium]